ncbi:MAG: nucleoside hydrolase [Planctomycetaceae bacterium]|nr:nucleoside hydrolase [Planctomycetaceae bacterium]
MQKFRTSFLFGVSFMSIILTISLDFSMFQENLTWANEPVKLIFDTDIGNDVDDVLALAAIHALQNRNECELLAVTITKDNKYAAPVAEQLNTFYGRSDVPIGIVKDGATKEDGNYLVQVYNTKDTNGNRCFPSKITAESSDIPDAVNVLRKTLTAQPDESVVVVQVGFSTNLARLLDSPADDISPLNGKELAKKKVKLLSTMAGSFAKQQGEYNITCDVKSAQKLFAEWPTPIVFSGWEIGMAVQYPTASIKNEYNYVPNHPVQIAYKSYRQSLDKTTPAFDPTSVLYAVRPERDYFGLSEPVDVTFDDNGVTFFKPNPNGKSRYLTVTPEQIVRTSEALSGLCSEPPKK